MKSKFLQHIIAATAFILILSAFAAIASVQYQLKVEFSKRVVTNEMIELSSRLEGLINEQLYKAKGLGVFYAMKPDASFEEYTDYCQLLYKTQPPEVRSLTLLKDTTAVFVWPLSGNEKVLGTDLTTIAAQRPTIEKVKEEFVPVTTGPVKLVQGGLGIITRMPVLTKYQTLEEQYLGQVSIVLDYDTILKMTGINELNESYAIKITSGSSASQKIIYESNEKALVQPIYADVTLPSATWRIEAHPKEGWGGNLLEVYTYLILGLFFAAGSFYYIESLLSTRSKLNLLVSDRTKELIQTNEYLEETLAEVEEKQAELFIVNDMLEQSLDHLKETQDQLIQAEKFAALGELVAGVAHEINTPLGIGITLGTFIQSKHDHLQRSFFDNKLSRHDMEEYIEALNESLNVMVNSLNRSAEIIASFKNVAVEQSSLELRTFNVTQYINDVLLNLKPRLKKTEHKIVFNCPEDLELYGYPGALSHIITNFIMNSLIHGFDNILSGNILIDISKSDQMIKFVYKDDGKGISKEVIDKVFDPFFTTKKGEGSSGLGLHIIHNIVTQTLNGQIRLESTPGHGVEFVITFPALKQPVDMDE